jgi:hypothetical protein
LATGEPAVSDLFTSLVTKGPVYNILLPVKESGRVEFILILGVKVDDLLPILRGQQLAAGSAACGTATTSCSQARSSPSSAANFPPISGATRSAEAV